MPDPLVLQRELAELDARQAHEGLHPDEERRRDLLRDALGVQVRDETDDVGYVFDPESGYYWHPVARHWYEPNTGTYFDEAGTPLEPVGGEATAADEAGGSGDGADRADGALAVPAVTGRPDEPAETRALPLPEPIELPPDDGGDGWLEPAPDPGEPEDGTETATAELPAPLEFEDEGGRPDEAVELVGGVGFLAAAACANLAAPPAPELELPPDEGPLELARTVDFLELARAAQAPGEDVDLEDEPAAPEGLPPVAVHRFVDRRRQGSRAGDEELEMAPITEVDPAATPVPPAAVAFPSAGPAPAAPRAVDAGGETATAAEPALLDASLELAAAEPALLADASLELAAEPALLADADVALVDEARPEEDRSVSVDPPRPPPLPPRPSGAERLALPGPASDFDLYAPALLEDPAAPFEVAGSAWSRVLDADRPETVPAPGRPAEAPTSPVGEPEAAPEAPVPPRETPAVRAAAPVREAPPRPPPPVLPQAADRAGGPPPLPQVQPPEPAGGVAPVPAPREASATHAASWFADDLLGASPSPTYVAGERQVVIHTREGQALRGSLRDVDLEASTLPLETRGGTVRVPVNRIRAVFFMVPIGAPLPAPRGRKARVVFEDGRPVSGMVADYRHDDPGFFLMPLETRGRTERIYVYREGIRSVAFA